MKGMWCCSKNQIWTPKGNQCLAWLRVYSTSSRTYGFQKFLEPMIYYMKLKLLQKKCQNWELSSAEWQWLVWSVSKEVCICINILAFHLKYPIAVPKTKERLQIALFFGKFLFWSQYWHFLSFCRAVTKISSFWVNTTSRQGIKRLGVSFGSIFLLFSYKSSWGKSLAPRS